MWETLIQSLSGNDPLEVDKAPHSSILAWRIHGQRSLVGYSPWDRKELDRTERLTLPLPTAGLSQLAVPGTVSKLQIHA